jgi:hypothetical protein
MEDGTVNLMCSWLDDTNDTASILGQLLFKINNGDFNEHLIHMLGANCKDGESDEFMMDVFRHWRSYVEGLDTPLISPVSALKMRIPEGNLTDDKIS